MRGTLPSAVAETLAANLEQSREQALGALRSGLGGARQSLEGFFGQAGQLTGAVDWSREPAEEDWWAVRSGETVALASPGDFRLTLTPQALTCGEVTVFRTAEGDLSVGQGEESWVVRPDGTVLTGQALDEAVERGFGKIEQGLEKVGQWSGARAPVGQGSQDWMQELLGGLAAVARLVPRVAETGCPECGQPLTPGARFCSQCGHKLSLHPDHCPGCQAPTPPEMRFCAQCGQRLD